MAVLGVLATVSLLEWPVVGFLPWPGFTFLLLGPTVVWLAWKRPNAVVVGAAFATSFMLAVLLASGINVVAFVLLPASLSLGLVWLMLAARAVFKYWTDRNTD